jgi:hypothetical protein
MDNYTETLSVITRAADVTGDPLGLLGQVGDLLDRWAARCERIRQRESVDELDAFVEWTVLLTQAGEVLSVCQHADTSGTLPGKCKHDSAQFLAYKLGQLAARFATENAHLWQDFMEESDQPGRVDFLVEALLCDLEARPDWYKLRDRYETGWRRTLVCDRASVEEISPAIDLYWAMRIGFADKMLEATHALEVAAPPVAAPDLIGQIQRIEDIASTTALRLIKRQREEDERRPPTEQELRLFLEERLARVWDSLPSDVTDALLSAEYAYRAGWQSGIPTRAVVKGFHEAVEACFEWYFAKPFATYLNEGGVSHTTVYWGVWREQPQKSEFQANNPRCLSLGRWAGAFKVAADADLPASKNLQVATFLKDNWPDLGKDALRELADSLGKVQDYRNRAEHPHSPPRPRHTERSELGEMRKLVLGTADSPSIIAQIYRLLGASKQS